MSVSLWTRCMSASLCHHCSSFHCPLVREDSFRTSVSVTISSDHRLDVCQPASLCHHCSSFHGLLVREDSCCFSPSTSYSTAKYVLLVSYPSENFFLIFLTTNACCFDAVRGLNVVDEDSLTSLSPVCCSVTTSPISICSFIIHHHAC